MEAEKSPASINRGEFINHVFFQNAGTALVDKVGGKPLDSIGTIEDVKLTD